MKGRVTQIVANVEKMAFVGENPWWIGVEGEDRGQATNLGEQDVTASVMLERSGANFLVQKARLRGEIKVDGQKLTGTVPDHFAIMREDTRNVLGIVSRRYEPVQNHEAFEFFDSVVGAGQAIYHTAGILGIGERVWLLARLPQEIKVNGSDMVENFLLLTTGHDGYHSFQIMFTPVRTVCQNTLNIALAGASGTGYRLSHFLGIRRRLNTEDAQKALGLAEDFIEQFGEQANWLGQQAISDEQIDGLLQRVFPCPKKLLLPAGKASDEPFALLPEPKKEDLAPEFSWVGSSLPKTRALVKELIQHGKGNDDPAVAGTRWAAFNGVAEYTDYLAGWDSTRTNSLLFGGGRDVKQHAWNLLTTEK